MRFAERSPIRELSLGATLVALLAGAALAGPPYTVFWGNFHSHSTLSDGAGPPSDAFIYARDTAGIDVLALSDHTHMLSATEWNTLGTVAQAYTNDGTFVALRAQEFGILSDFGHVGIQDCDIKNPNATTNLPATYQFIIDQNACGIFNHPNPAYGTWFDNLAYYPEYESAMVGMEVANGLYSGDYEDIWIEAMNNGWKLGPMANQDNHTPDWGDRPNPNDGNRIYLTGVLAEDLTPRSILDALHARRFFASEQRPKGDLLAVDFMADGAQMGSEIVHAGSSVAFDATVTSLDGITLCNRIDFYKDGVIVESHVQIGTTISHTFVDTGLSAGEQHYYFVRGRQTDGDLVWSSPIWVTIEAGSADVPDDGALPATAQLLPNSPNPFTPQTDIRFILPQSPNGAEHRVRLTIHDPSGRLIRDLGERKLGAGEHRWTWDGRDDDGVRVASGVYLYRLHGEDLPSTSGRMIFLSR
ncbi:MAG: CehA/McbA family metallohydrolase [Candidatus Eisenbacteria bacterium]|uniref:CehA/McbA family metallohydrolase n=1 Tax=Eiseniibacteriota bacterium TaxID=2212470 RepID=A0A956M1G1_UNCEI|nr:CehA/McbA family metallohydrolase [Candidatus Eisenbacteria bacterium]